MALFVTKENQDIERVVFEVSGDIAIWSGQAATHASQPDDFGTKVEEDIHEQRGSSWNPTPISGKSVEPDTNSIGEWIVWIDDGEGDAIDYPGYATQLEAIEFAGIDQSKLLKTYELDAEWDKVESFWLSESNQSATTFNSSFFGRSNNQ
ncbi:hypothetical protein JCM19231_4092 [Vibrio ishigakensis]|uniref:Uncharacterized protein n=2 Tax=Vibrio ishigakensis TaxID=1481914 RepID=A0A0B8NUH9_9VIBR|nr:hypothetical protein JCM19231_4092 [Vibrio ishigakensis]